MKLNFVFINYKMSDKFKEMFTKKFTKLQKYFKDDVDADIKVTKEGDDRTLEATIYAGNTIFRAEVASDDLYKNIDSVVAKLEKQVIKYKNKLNNHTKTYFNLSMIEDVDYHAGEEKVIKTKQIVLKPMDVDEAIMQMELLGHNFFIFQDSDSNQMSIIYKRHDDQIGLIEPVYE